MPRSKVCAALAIEDVDPVRTGMRNVEAHTGADRVDVRTGMRNVEAAAAWSEVGVGMIESGLDTGRHGRKADAPQRQAALPTFSLQ